MVLLVDLLHWAYTSVYFHMLPYDGCHFEWQKCIAVIER